MQTRKTMGLFAQLYFRLWNRGHIQKASYQIGKVGIPEKVTEKLL